MRIILVGFMSSGKTTVGRYLARKANMELIDIDEAFESRYKMSITSFFDLFGEAKFRELEHQILLDSFKHDNCIIATGGGTPCFFDNMNLIKENGISVYLKLHINSIVHRLLHTKKQRPLIKNLNPEELVEYVSKQINYRESFYNQAQFIYHLENKKPNEVYSLLKECLAEAGIILP
ncbi:MAG: shikimate kinase [Bacteroidetes bacterium]|nr:shikimate kinase [Bacteroidota bacterium]